MEPIDFTQLVIVLVWLAGPVGMAAWMLFLSNGVRNLREANLEGLTPADAELAKWVRSLSPLKLQILVTGLAFVVPSAAAAILQYVPRETLESLQPTFAFIATLMLVYIGQQIWFQITKKPAPVIAGPAAFAIAGGGSSSLDDGLSELLDDGQSLSSAREQTPTLAAHVGRPGVRTHPGVQKNTRTSGAVRDDQPNKPGRQVNTGTHAEAAEEAKRLGLTG